MRLRGIGWIALALVTLAIAVAPDLITLPRPTEAAVVDRATLAVGDSRTTEVALPHVVFPGPATRCSCATASMSRRRRCRMSAQRSTFRWSTVGSPSRSMAKPSTTAPTSGVERPVRRHARPGAPAAEPPAWPAVSPDPRGRGRSASPCRPICRGSISAARPRWCRPSSGATSSMSTVRTMSLAARSCSVSACCWPGYAPARRLAVLGGRLHGPHHRRGHRHVPGLPAGAAARAALPGCLRAGLGPAHRHPGAAAGRACRRRRHLLLGTVAVTAVLLACAAIGTPLARIVSAAIGVHCHLRRRHCRERHHRLGRPLARQHRCAHHAGPGRC